VCYTTAEAQLQSHPEPDFQKPPANESYASANPKRRRTKYRNRKRKVIEFHTRQRLDESTVKCDGNSVVPFLRIRAIVAIANEIIHYLVERA
jgi:hypothetical protein